MLLYRGFQPTPSSRLGPLASSRFYSVLKPFALLGDPIQLRSFALAFLACAWLAAAGCSDVESSADAGGVEPDASSAEPDASSAKPDAGSAELDASSAEPDAAPSDSDGAVAKADIAVIDANLDVHSAKPGAYVRVVSRVRNSGDAPGKKTLELEVDGEVEKSKDVWVDAPASGQTSEDTEVEAEIFFSRDAPGDYEISVSGVEAGMVRVTEAALVVTTASSEPNELDMGETITVRATVQNHSEAEGEKSLELRVEGEIEAEQSVSVQPPGSGEGPGDTEIEAEFQFSRDTPGDYEVKVNDLDAGPVTVLSDHTQLETTAICFDEPSSYAHVTEEADLAPGEFERLLAVCPDDLVVLGGGVRIDDFSSADPEVHIHHSSPGTVGGQPITWHAGVSNEADEARAVEVYAICATEPEGYTFSFGPVEESLDSGSFERLRGQCPDEGGVIYSGGFFINNHLSSPSNTRIHETFPGESEGGARDEWVVGISNESGRDHEVSVQTVCAQEKAGYVQASEQGEVGPGEFEGLTAQCPDDGSHISAGGIRVPDLGSEEPPTKLRQSYPSASASRHQWSFGVSDTRPGD